MKRSQLVLFSLSCILAISVFLPLVDIPFLGSMNYFMNGKGDGRYILLLAIIAAVISFTPFAKWVCIPGVVSLLIVGLFFINFSHNSGFLHQEKYEGAFSELASSFTKGISISYGFAIMAMASVGLTFLPPWLVEKDA